MTKPSLQERFISALNDENFSQAAHHLEHMDTPKAIAAIPLVLDYLRHHAEELRTRAQVHLPAGKRSTAPLELHDLHPNLIPAKLWAAMLKKLAGSKVRYNDEDAVKPALDVLRLSVRTRREDVLPHILAVVHKIRRGEHYDKSIQQKIGIHPTPVGLLEVLNHLEAHTEKLPIHQQDHVPAYGAHVNKEVLERQVRNYRL